MLPLLTILIIPGAFFQPLHYQPLQQRLIAELNVNVQVLSLPSATSSAANLFVDANYVAANIQETAGNIVPVAHSYGGVVLSQAIGQLNSNDASRIRHLVYMAAFIIPQGVTLAQLLSGAPPVFTVDNSTGTSFPINPRQNFLGDLPDAEAAFYQNLLVHTATQALLGPGPTVTGYANRDLTYIETALDKAIPVAVQQSLVANASKLVSHLDVHVVQSSHVVFLSHTEDVAQIIGGAVNQLN